VTRGSPVERRRNKVRRVCPESVVVTGPRSDVENSTSMLPGRPGSGSLASPRSSLAVGRSRHEVAPGWASEAFPSRLCSAVSPPPRDRQSLALRSSRHPPLHVRVGSGTPRGRLLPSLTHPAAAAAPPPRGPLHRSRLWSSTPGRPAPDTRSFALLPSVRRCHPTHLVPSSWFLTTSTVCSDRRSRRRDLAALVCCTQLPILGFAPFPPFAAPKRDTGFPGTLATPRRIFHADSRDRLTACSEEPALTAILCPLAVHRVSASSTPKCRLDRSPARLRGLAPSTCPLRWDAVASIQSPGPPMGFCSPFGSCTSSFG